MRRKWIMVPLVLALGALVGGCTEEAAPDPEPEPTETTSAAVEPAVNLTFGVWGSEAEVEAFEGVVAAYNAENDEVTVKVKAYASAEEMLTAIEDGKAPDVFLSSRGDLAHLVADELNQPINALLDDRDVDFGDDYARLALEAFSSDRALQCMPYGVSPMVIYYNRKLVDFEKMARRGFDVPRIDNEDLTRKVSWNFEQFRIAADFASRPRRGVSGFYIAPTLRSLAPFVYTAGGEIYNDEEPPTSLTFSADDTRSALEKVLPVLRDPKLTLSAEQLAEKSPLEWFAEGKLGMIAGFRDLAPQLQEFPEIDFDVLPIPIVDSSATVGDLTGICLARETKNIGPAADFLVDLISAESVAAVTGAGYLVPANTEVALSEVFLQPGSAPLHSNVFYNSVKHIRIPPLIEDFAALEEAVAAPIRELLEVELPDLEELTERIDEASRTVLAPEPESSDDAEPDS